MGLKLNVKWIALILVLSMVFGGLIYGTYYLSYTKGYDDGIENGTVEGLNQGYLQGQKAVIKVLATGLCEEEKTMTCDNGKICGCVEVPNATTS